MCNEHEFVNSRKIKMYIAVHRRFEKTREYLKILEIIRFNYDSNTFIWVVSGLVWNNSSIVSRTFYSNVLTYGIQ